ncbi:MAG: tRNA-(ms[2]io[6]A)-hydroxylase [Flavobacteriaceae bacterium]|jgi:tRNA-(ms[2]io[6]A)-hydroxylase|nr:tRNA 2-methylthio-N6-isopentenyl adenosine(37) hydroxylase MiaE [Flavobacteriaceae bacterium]MDG2062849.1 tRNA-(ms[2]io[6]A)-hydroxylase [Flavobacteriaceae bacterium]|tara:strand:- start:438 stop:1022 length:585 start_codon:yes stop_codon:yes gene_type:complete
MLSLKLPTDPNWVNIAKMKISEILSDHAYCEQKAASTAISMIISFPQYPKLVSAMADLAQEEMSHFKMVHDLIIERGLKLGRERKDYYVINLRSFFPKGGSKNDHLIHKLLVAGLIEARSCERFRILSEKLEDIKLRKFYRKLMISEASHYTMFLRLARHYGNSREQVDMKWENLLDYEAELINTLGDKESIHG